MSRTYIINIMRSYYANVCTLKTIVLTLKKVQRT